MASALLQSTRVPGRAFFGSQVTPKPTIAPRKFSPVSTTVVAAYGDLVKIGPGKKWEHRELTASGKAVKEKLHVKKGDFVVVIAGKDKGKTGTIKECRPKDGEVIVEGVNVVTKHVKPKAQNESGQIKQMEAPIHSSNVMHYSKDKSVRSRVGHKVVEGKKVRYLIKTGEIID